LADRRLDQRLVHKPAFDLAGGFVEQLTHRNRPPARLLGAGAGEHVAEELVHRRRNVRLRLRDFPLPVSFALLGERARLLGADRADMNDRCDDSHAQQQHQGGAAHQTQTKQSPAARVKERFFASVLTLGAARLQRPKALRQFGG
jgi:hypothetical protein